MAARTLQLESLESRNLMAAAAWMSGTTLVVVADPNGGTVNVRPVSNTIQVDGPGLLTTVNASGVTALQFHGSSRRDVFTNTTSVNATVYGNAGDDELNSGKGTDVVYGGDGNDTIDGGNGTYSVTSYYYGFVPGRGLVRYTRTVTHPTTNTLYGGPGNDTLIGGTGSDRIYGESGNDNLYGHESNDTLDGGSGNDGLYGGAQNDVLTGGVGSDRFLRYNGGGDIRDTESADVHLVFSSADLIWTDREVEAVDVAFQQLQNRVGGATWILKDRLTGDPLTFVKARDLGPGVGGRNSVTWAWFDYDRRISILDWNEYSLDANDWARSTMIHEIGHNWDGTGYPLASEPNPYWGRFTAEHDRSTKIDNFDNVDFESPDFARDYGQTNAKEDWCTTWELYFGATGPATRSPILQAKLALVDAFFSFPPN